MLTQDVAHVPPPTPEPGRNVLRVLVAYDGSKGARAALARGIEVAVANHALLTIAAVVEQPVVACTPFSATCMPFTPEQMRRDAEQEMRRELAAARDEVPATVSVTTQLLCGRPARVLAALAESGHYDLVVTGQTRRCRLFRLLRGSVTRRLLTRTHASVLAVKAA